MKKPKNKNIKRESTVNPRQKIETLLNHLDTAIQRGEFSEGDQLPSRRMLSEEFGIHPTSVSVALKKLAERHPIRFIAGKGAFLASQAASKSLSIGLIGHWQNLTSAFFDPAANYYHGPILHGLLETAELYHHTVIIIPHHPNQPLDIDRFTSHNPDCVISFMDNLTEDEIYKLRKLRIPLLRAHRGGEDRMHLGNSYVDWDNIGTIRKTVRLFVEHGHRHIGAIFTQSHDSAWETWRDTFILEAVKHGLPILPENVRIVAREDHDDTKRTLQKELSALLDLTPPPTAIYCSSLREQSSIFETEITKRNLVAGKDISIVFCIPKWLEDRIPYSSWSLDLKQIGMQLVETAIKIAQDPDKNFMVDIPMVFIDKNSVSTIN